MVKNKPVNIDKLIDVEARKIRIAEVSYFNAGDATFGEGPRDPHPLDLMTVCTVRTECEQDFVGRFTAPSPAEYDRKAGEAGALAAAKAEIRKLTAIRFNPDRPEGLRVNDV